jgi:predicted permease
MLEVLTHNILPVFSMLALGFILGRTGTTSEGEAKVLNRTAFLILQPALIFPLIASIDLQSFDIKALAIYAMCQVVMFSAAYAIARLLFKRAHMESYLLSMAMIFVNSLLYIWPISYLIYGEAAALPITAIVAWDSAVTFAFFIISCELMAGDKTSDTGPSAFRRIYTNPVLIAIALGFVVNIAGLSLPVPLLNAAEFIGAGAAPLTLFALGVILSGHALMPTPVVAAFSGLKLIGFPLLVWAALSVFSPGNAWADLFNLTAAGPSGAMAFALAMLYNIRTDAIAPVVIWTSVLSLLSLAYLA